MLAIHDRPGRVRDTAHGVVFAKRSCLMLACQECVQPHESGLQAAEPVLFRNAPAPFSVVQAAYRCRDELG